jgi:D-alanyl-D-alanine dipeptidase
MRPSRGRNIEKPLRFLPGCGMKELFMHSDARSISLSTYLRSNTSSSWLALLLAAAVVLQTGCQHGPPRERGTFRPSDLVELNHLEPTLKLDIRYAGTNNFMHRPMYREARAFLQRPAAEALVRAHRALAAQGFGLMIFDGYRPWSVTKQFWDAASPEERRIEFVANPRKGSRHNRGCAVDLTLYDLKTGKEVTMPSGYDEFSERAYPDYSGGPREPRERRDLLRRTMEAQGFTVYKAEWWHFDYQDWTHYRILNLPFDQIVR